MPWESIVWTESENLKTSLGDIFGKVGRAESGLFTHWLQEHIEVHIVKKNIQLFVLSV